MLKPSEENDAYSRATCSCLQEYFEPSQDHSHFLTGCVNSVRPALIRGRQESLYTSSSYLLFKQDFLYFKLCVHVSMQRFVHVNAGAPGGRRLVLDPRSWRPRQLPNMGAGDWREGCALSHWATSLALPRHFQSGKGRRLCTQTEKQLVYRMFHTDTVSDSAH